MLFFPGTTLGTPQPSRKTWPILQHGCEKAAANWPSAAILMPSHAPAAWEVTSWVILASQEECSAEPMGTKLCSLVGLGSGFGRGYFFLPALGIWCCFRDDSPSIGPTPHLTSLVDHQPKGPGAVRNNPPFKASLVSTVRPWSRPATLPAPPATRSASRVPYMDATEMMRIVIPKMGTLGRYETICRAVWGNRDQDIIDGKSQNKDIMPWFRFPQTRR